MKKHSVIIFLLSLNMIFATVYCNGQSYNLYVANEHFTAANIYELDVMIANTSGSDFLLRTVQNGILLNPDFIPAGASIVASYVEGSSQMTSYKVGTVEWIPGAKGFQTSANSGVTCSNGTIVPASGNPLRVATYRLTSSLPFNCAESNPVMFRPTDPVAVSRGLSLREAVTKWADQNCSKTKSVSINSSGTFAKGNTNTGDMRVTDKQNFKRPNSPAEPKEIVGASLVCKRATSASFAASPVGDASSYTWTVTGGAIITAGQGTRIVTVDFSNATSSSSEISVTADNACGSSFRKVKAVSVDLTCENPSEFEKKIGNSDESFSSFSAYPNPTASKTTVEFYSASSSKYTLKLTDMAGKTIFEKVIPSASGYNSKEISLDQFSNGVYYLLLQGKNGEEKSVKLVIEK